MVAFYQHCVSERNDDDDNGSLSLSCQFALLVS